MRNNENGRSMVEMLGVLAIIGVLSAGGLAGYSKAMFKHKLNTTMEQITMLVTNIRTAYGTQKNYAGLTGISVIDNLGALPAGIRNGSVYRNPFKGEVTVAASQARKGVDASGFTVTYSNLPKEACIALATADFGSGAGSGFVGVVVGAASQVGTTAGTNPDVYIGSGNTAYTNAGTEGAKDTLSNTAGSRGEGQAYSMSAAITACSSETNNAIAWKFY